MTKQDILKLKTCKEVMKALAEHRELWDKETDDYRVKLAKKELRERFGSEDVLYTPPKKKST